MSGSLSADPFAHLLALGRSELRAWGAEIRGRIEERTPQGIDVLVFEIHVGVAAERLLEAIAETWQQGIGDSDSRGVHPVCAEPAARAKRERQRDVVGLERRCAERCEL